MTHGVSVKEAEKAWGHAPLPEPWTGVLRKVALTESPEHEIGVAPPAAAGTAPSVADPQVAGKNGWQVTGAPRAARVPEEGASAAAVAALPGPAEDLAAAVVAAVAVVVAAVAGSCTSLFQTPTDIRRIHA